MTKEKKVEILYDHYKDTFENIKVYLQRRNWYTLSTIILTGLLSIELSAPTIPNELAGELIKKNIGDFKVDYNYISSIIVFGLMWSILLYYQINFLIEKMYAYLHNLEEALTSEMNPHVIGREGKNYLNNYPLLSSVAHRIYTVLFPVLIIAVAVIKWVSEKKQLGENWKSGYFLFDSIILSLIVLFSVLYFVNRNFSKS